ncbi:MAG: hypothetical protein CL917_15015 [Deltaproteobacteria bacterium]|nr:hypothetical protein [Deltaproteobacteria bacterium]
MTFKTKVPFLLIIAFLFLWILKDASAQQIEAESGVLMGSASAYDDPEAFGGQGVAYISSANAGFRLSNAPAASGIDIRYASERSGSLSVFLNGRAAGRVNFTATGDWVGDYGLTSFVADIPPGADLAIIFQNGDTPMNIDYVRFLGKIETSPILEAETRIDAGDETVAETGVETEHDPSPNPEQLTNSRIFGIDPEGRLFHRDEGWSADFHYLCLNGNCLPGIREDGFFQRSIENEASIGESIRVEFKVESNGSQCLTGDTLLVRQSGFSLANSPCTSIANQVEVESIANNETFSESIPEPLPESAEDSDSFYTDEGSERGAGLISFSGDAIITRFAERFRDRHESDLNHDTYISEYAQGSAYEIILTDRPDALEVQIHSPQAPLSMVNFTHDHIINSGFADPPQYRSGGFMSKGSIDGPANDSANQLANRLYFEIRSTNGRPWSEVRRNREIVTLEFTPRRPLNGNFPQYYSDIFRYRAGQGGITFERDDPRYFSAGPTTHFAHGSPSFEFSQPYLGIGQRDLNEFTLGRELFRASFRGEALPGNGGQATGADPNLEVSACVDCHFQLGKAAPPGRATRAQQGFTDEGRNLRVAPQLIGLGLLEAIDSSTIAELARMSGGKVPEGRFGWKATEATIRDQILKAFDLDLGVRDVDPTFIDRVEQYIRGLGVPMRRHPVAQVNQDPNVGLRVPDEYAITNPNILKGEAAFVGSKCTQCHVPTIETGNDHPIAQFRNITIRPFTDLLLWDMGPELCAETGEGSAGPCEWRTAPLWGIRLQAQVTGHRTFLHDGRATSLDEAIRLHGGDAQAARDAYLSLPEIRRIYLLLYLLSL